MSEGLKIGSGATAPPFKVGSLLNMKPIAFSVLVSYQMPFKKSGSANTQHPPTRMIVMRINR